MYAGLYYNKVAFNYTTPNNIIIFLREDKY